MYSAVYGLDHVCCDVDRKYGPAHRVTRKQYVGQHQEYQAGCAQDAARISECAQILAGAAKFAYKQDYGPYYRRQIYENYRNDGYDKVA